MIYLHCNDRKIREDCIFCLFLIVQIHDMLALCALFANICSVYGNICMSQWLIKVQMFF